MGDDHAGQQDNVPCSLTKYFKIVVFLLCRLSRTCLNGCMVDVNSRDDRATPTEKQILTDLQELAASPGFIYTLAHVTLTDFFLVHEHDAATAEWQHRLSTDELTLVAGLTAKHPIDIVTVPTSEHRDAQIKQLYRLLVQLHRATGQPLTDRFRELSPNLQDSPGPGGGEMPKLVDPDNMVEPIFYSNLGAHDFQYVELAYGKYLRDAGWLDRNTGLPMDRLAQICVELKRLRGDRANADHLPSGEHERCQEELAILSFSRRDLAFLTDRQFDQFVKQFVSVPGELEFVPDVVGAMNDLEFKPILRIGPDCFFMASGFNLAKSIYDSPRFWMQQDLDYADQADANRGRATEEITARMLATVFGDRVHRNVVVWRNNKVVTDIDVLAISGDRALVVQAKSKRLTEIARKGNVGQLIKDFTQAVQEAYAQGIQSRHALLSDGYRLSNGSGDPIELPEHIADVYVLCVTLDPFRAVTHMANGLLVNEPGDPHPLAISVFDLEILTAFLDDPFEFLYYVRNRVRGSEHFHAVSEKALLGLHLSQNLLPRNGSVMTPVYEDWAHRLDADLRVLRGLQSPHPSGTYLPGWWQNNRLRQVADLLKDLSEPASMDALFALYDACDSHRNILQNMEAARSRCARTQEIIDFSLAFDGFGLSYVCFPRLVWDIPDRLGTHVAARKYRGGADAWLGLAGVVGSSRPAVLATWQSHPWEPDPKLE